MGGWEGRVVTQCEVKAQVRRLSWSRAPLTSQPREAKGTVCLQSRRAPVPAGKTEFFLGSFIPEFFFGEVPAVSSPLTPSCKAFKCLRTAERRVLGPLTQPEGSVCGGCDVNRECAWVKPSLPECATARHLRAKAASQTSAQGGTAEPRRQSALTPVGR